MITFSRNGEKYQLQLLLRLWRCTTTQVGSYQLLQYWISSSDNHVPHSGTLALIYIPSRQAFDCTIFDCCDGCLVASASQWKLKREGGTQYIKKLGPCQPSTSTLLRPVGCPHQMAYCTYREEGPYISTYVSTQVCISHLEVSHVNTVPSTYLTIKHRLDKGQHGHHSSNFTSNAGLLADSICSNAHRRRWCTLQVHAQKRDAPLPATYERLYPSTKYARLAPMSYTGSPLRRSKGGKRTLFKYA